MFEDDSKIRKQHRPSPGLKENLRQLWDFIRGDCICGLKENIGQLWDFIRGDCISASVVSQGPRMARAGNKTVRSNYSCEYPEYKTARSNYSCEHPEYKTVGRNYSCEHSEYKNVRSNYSCEYPKYKTVRNKTVRNNYSYIRGTPRQAQGRKTDQAAKPFGTTSRTSLGRQIKPSGV